jgi:uncharacterized protein
MTEQGSVHPGAVTETVLTLVKEKCESPNNRFGLEFIDQHILVVQRFALILAEKFGADQKAVSAAALLHDISAIEDFDNLSEHAELSAKRAVELLSPGGALSAIGFDAHRIERIATCMSEHSTPRRHGETIVESVCVSNADAMSQIVRPFYWYNYARDFKMLSNEGALQWYRALVERNWEPLIDAGKNLVKEEYEAALVITR